MATNKISTNQFMWNKDSKTFAQYASSMPEDFNGLSKLKFSDNKRGFYLESAKTGTIIEMVCFSVDRSSEYEVEGWKYRPTSKQFNFELLIIND